MLTLCAVLGLAMPLSLIGVGLHLMSKDKRSVAALPPGAPPAAPPQRGAGTFMVVIGALQLGAMALLGAVLAALGDMFLGLLDIDFTAGLEGRVARWLHEAGETVKVIAR